MVIEFENSITRKSSAEIQEPEKAIIVHAYLAGDKNEDDVEECTLLAKSAQLNVIDKITLSRNAPHVKYFVGKGKAEEIAEAVKAHEADIVLVNHALSAAQARNLEKLCQCTIIDRTALILDIFAQRARSHEGKLQVELAQLKHLSTRLIRGWTHLERQKGGIGLRGPGETQLETDRRLIKVRISQLQARLEKVNRQRNLNRHTRQKSDVPTISLVGYTNAGKSTLFNRLTEADVYAADQLFATLDPTLRQITLEKFGSAILADTVGFIRHLPHDLVSAFKSTLQETIEADLLLHVIDASDDQRLEYSHAVNEVLTEIGATDVPTLLVFNKIDRLESVKPHIDYDEDGIAKAVYLSAETGEGCHLLLEAIMQRLQSEILSLDIILTPVEGKIRHELYQLNCIQAESINEQGEFVLKLLLDKNRWLQLIAHYPQLNQFYQLPKQYL